MLLDFNLNRKNIEIILEFWYSKISKLFEAFQRYAHCNFSYVQWKNSLLYLANV